MDSSQHLNNNSSEQGNQQSFHTSAIDQEDNLPNDEGPQSCPTTADNSNTRSALSVMDLATPPEPGTASPAMLSPWQGRSYAPSVPSPLNQGSPVASLQSTDSLCSTEETDSSRQDDASSPSRDNGDDAGPVTDRRAPPRPPPRRGNRKKRHRRSFRPLPPIGLDDAAQDYSRYPISGPRYIPSQVVGDSVESGGPSLPTAIGHSYSSKNSSVAPLSEKSPQSSSDPIIAPAIYMEEPNYPIFTDEKELDDDMHLPDPSDDKYFKPTWRVVMTKEGMISILSLAFMIAGVLAIFVVLPVLAFTGTEDRLETHTNALQGADRTYPLFRNIRHGLIDPTTPKSAMTRPSVDGGTLQLVFSDEFNTDNRTFYPGDDPYWTAPDFWYGATKDLEWYDADAPTTLGGTLNLEMQQFQNHNLSFRSGMLNSWNQLCFKGGALEVSVSLPGPPGVPGLWPGVWTMGNLGRPGYMASTDGVWPYTYSQCDVGVTPNQSQTDGLSFLPGQKLPSCACPGEDHPSPGTGRGAPEIDVFEASVDDNNRIGVVTQSFQVAPFDIWYYPNYEFFEIPNYGTTQVNTYCGGPYQQALSGTTLLNPDWYDGVNYQKFAFEYKPGTADGSIAWFVGTDVSYRILGKSIGPNGNVGQRQISEEPMSIVLNLGLSESWSWIDWANLTFPTSLRIDYVRIYQPAGSISVTCDPEGFETTEYINAHPLAYTDQNLTVNPSLSGGLLT